MNFVTLYNAMRKRATGSMPDMPATAGVMQPKNPLPPLPPPISIDGAANSTPADSAKQVALEQPANTVSDLTAALNNITSLAKQQNKGEQQAQGLGQPQQGAALAQVTGSVPSPQQSGTSQPLGGMSKTESVSVKDLPTVFKSLCKRATSYEPDKASTSADQYGLTTNFSAKAPTKHYTYPMPKKDGRPTMPKIQELGGYQADVPKRIPRVMEYKPDTNEYQMHQYPYAKEGYPTTSTKQYDAAQEAVTGKDSLMSDASKKNYTDMMANNTFSPATALQYNEYLKWRKATGGKTNPTGK